MATEQQAVQQVQTIARAFHEAYEQLAPEFGYTTRRSSAVPWDKLPKRNKQLMLAVVAVLLQTRIIRSGDDAA